MDSDPSSTTSTEGHLLAIPAELRIMIFERCLDNPPLRYAYLPPDKAQKVDNFGDDLCTQELHRHAMLLVNRQLSGESMDSFA